MGKLGNISGKEAVKAFQRAGWELVGQVGSHCVLTKQGMRVNLSVLSTENFQLEHYAA
jgi:predicted RNA binding protein YcfA (HicA-like mRNA interferase family)